MCCTQGAAGVIVLIRNRVYTCTTFQVPVGPVLNRSIDPFSLIQPQWRVRGLTVRNTVYLTVAEQLQEVLMVVLV